MKKILILIFCLIFLTGCTNSKATDPVKEYMEKYRNNAPEIQSSIEELLRQANMLEEQDELYRIIMKKQYIDLEYKITKETYNGDKANIEVEITVYDYEHSRIEAEKYRQEKKQDYVKEDGTWDKERYVDLQLKYMQKEIKRVKYTVNFNVNLQNEKWVLEPPDSTIIKKIHGIYNYNED